MYAQQLGKPDFREDATGITKGSKVVFYSTIRYAYMPQPFFYDN